MSYLIFQSKLYGNSYIQVKFRPWHIIFLEDIISTFYVYNFLSFVIWIFSKDYEYASIVGVMLVTGLYGEIKNRINRHDRIQKLNSEATNVVVKRSDFYGNSYYISSNVKKVSPGDVICLTNVGEIL